MKLTNKPVRKPNLFFLDTLIVSSFSVVTLVVYMNAERLGVYTTPLMITFFLLTQLYLVWGAFRIAAFIALLNKLSKYVQNISEGEYNSDIGIHVKGPLQMIIDPIVYIGEYVKNARDFVWEIGNGNLDAHYQGIEDQDVIYEESLTHALLNMRKQIKQLTTHENQQKWVTEGLTHFIQIILDNQQNMKVLCDRIISELVKYVGVNQGALFLIHDFTKQDQETYLEIISCYAYDRSRFLVKKFELGDGLVGQCWQEKDKLYYTEIPEEYPTIKSGLGQVAPCSILVVPMMINQKVCGVLELISLEEVPEYKQIFITKLSENIASTIISLKNAERTEKLLKEFKEQEEEMKAQEEEMRQNLEELLATQEQMMKQ